MFTLVDYLIIIDLAIIAILFSINTAIKKWYYGIINFFFGILLLVVLCVIINWYNTNTGSGIRAVKNLQSELNNGIKQEIIITNEYGREIFHYEGQIDIETDHDDNYIQFVTEEGKRYIIYYGIQDTIKIIEK